MTLDTQYPVIGHETEAVQKKHISISVVHQGKGESGREAVLQHWPVNSVSIRHGHEITFVQNS